MKFKKLNATQWSLIGPASFTFAAASLLGIGAFGLGVVGSLIATPIIFLNFSDKDRKTWKKAGMVTALTGTTFWGSGIAGFIGYEYLYSRINPEAYKTEEQARRQTNAKQLEKEREVKEANDFLAQSEGAATICEGADGAYVGIVSGQSCEGASKLVTASPRAGFMGMNHERIKRYEEAVNESIRKTQEEAERKKVEERERKADFAKWGPFFADFEVRQQAKKMCNDYAFKLTNQKQSWFYDNRADFDIKVIGDKIWIGGPITVKVKDGNIDGSDFRYQKGVDCYWSKSATSLEGGQITVK